MTAGAVMLTDSVYWIVIFPFYTIVGYELGFVSNRAYLLLLGVGFELIPDQKPDFKRFSYLFLVCQLTVVVHSLNLGLLLGDIALNSLRFPWFRISYFFLFTAFYVLFEWILHAFVATWWPYPFLDLSVEYAPLWYLIVATLHVPCYTLFMLIVKFKYYILARWFPQSLR
ncbi:uncharacterized protein LOC143624102 [Bidens hawaiensis]|uniref:uncharacterized protein LOC143624102 n=1 Tax=Bidens hawaiensis TaxID=980011 RepID=UPI00404B308A